jgi:hypothetical protein
MDALIPHELVRKAGERAVSRAGSARSERSLRATQRTLQQFDRAEGLLVDVLGQCDPEGCRPWDTARWEEFLDHVASLHARMLLVRARLEARGAPSRMGPQQGA